jgi:hypothetical protein
MVPCYEGSPELAPAGAYTCDLSISQCLEKWEERWLVSTILNFLTFNLFPSLNEC